MQSWTQRSYKKGLSLVAGSTSFVWLFRSAYLREVASRGCDLMGVSCGDVSLGLFPLAGSS